MALLKWNDSYSVSVESFDAQHQKLVGFINDLHDAMKSGKTKEVMKEIIENLIAYTQFHFSDEEKAMIQFGFSGFKEHKEEHKKLIEKVSEFKKKFDGGQVALSIEILNFLKDWLTSHILKTDKLYGPFLSQKGVK